MKQPIRAQLIIIRDPAKCFILGRNHRVVNGLVKLFLEIFCPYLSHIPYIWISENNLKYCINAFYGTFKKQPSKKKVISDLLSSCQVTFISVVIYTVQIVSKQLHRDKKEKQNQLWKLSCKAALKDSSHQSVHLRLFTFMHLADAFIQSDIQCIQPIHFLSVCVFPGN